MAKKSGKSNGAARAAARKGSRKRAPRKTVRADPGLEPQVSALAHKVEAKERSLSRVQAHALRRAAQQRESEETIRRLTAERDSLRATIDIIKGLRTVVGDERAAAVRDLKIAEADWAVLQKSLKHHESAATVKAAIDTVDGAINRLRKQVAAAEKKVDAADARFAKSRTALAALEKERRDAHEALQSLPNEIRAARGQVVRLIGDVKSAAPDDALRLASAERDVRSALDALRAHTRGNADEHLALSLLDTRAVDEARDRSAKDQESLDAAKKELADLRAALQVRLQQRDSDIRGRVLKNNTRANRG